MADVQRGDGLVSLTDAESFEVGQNVAATPGQVVYRNALVEVIQYAPQTESVRQMPIVLIQPWINKYYIFDLTPKNSLVRYLVRQGFTVFITSWKNPGPEMRHISFEDYMLHGALRAITVARKICSCQQVHAAGYCIGGTLLATLMGWLAHDKHQPVADVTLFATMLDFAQPGDLSCFFTPSTMKAIQPGAPTYMRIASRSWTRLSGRRPGMASRRQYCMLPWHQRRSRLMKSGRAAGFSSQLWSSSASTRTS